MNYRHIYHAGNFADVMKHLTLALCLDYMKKKEKGFCVIDAHAGRALYDLKSPEAQKTLEAQGGIARLMANPPDSDDMKLYIQCVKKDWVKDKYPGSPLIAARCLRRQDRLIANELHPQDYKTLKMVMGSHANTCIENRDAYECLRTHLPPAERRGLILIDPPFEKPDEFERLTRQAKQWSKRFPTGLYLVWYPLKMHLPYEAMKAEIASIFPDWLCFEILRFPEYQSETLNGCGLLILNPPYGLGKRLEALAPPLQQYLGLYEYRISSSDRATGD